MENDENKKKGKKICLISIILLVITLVSYSLFISNTEDIYSGLEIEDSIDLSYNQWTLGIQYDYTKVYDRGDGWIQVQDANINRMASAILTFSPIDIGKLKMEMSCQTSSRNYFAMEFRSGSTTLFKLERDVGIFNFMIDDIGIYLVDLYAEWRTIEIFFDLTDGDDGVVSVKLDGVVAIDEYIFDSNDKTITNIYMHTSTQIYQSRTDIKFEYLYNFA